jgi:hypothetical protein
MANSLQERYSNLVDAKLRSTLVVKDGVICNTKVSKVIQQQEQ